MPGRTRISALDGEALRVRELQLREAQVVADIGSFEWDLARGRLTWSDHMYRICGVPRDEGEPTAELFFGLMHPEDRPRCVAAASRQMETGESYEEPFRIVRPDGAVRWFQGRSHADLGKDGRPVRIIGICQDITQRVEAARALQDYAEQLRGISRRLVEAQEAERRRIATELHDRVGGNLAALAINLRLVEDRLSPESAARVLVKLRDCVRLVQETVAVTRDVMGELRPQYLDDYGLLAALRMLAATFQERTGVAASVRASGSVPERAAPSDLALYRIAQEALTNISKHAGARQVRMRLDGDGRGKACLEIEDDGRGFDPERAGGWGLRIMRERAASVGGRLEVESSAGRGAVVRVRVG